MEKTFLKLDKTELTPIGTEKEEKITVHKGTWNKIFNFPLFFYI